MLVPASTNGGLLENCKYSELTGQFRDTISPKWQTWCLQEDNGTRNIGRNVRILVCRLNRLHCSVFSNQKWSTEQHLISFQGQSYMRTYV
jgi:hypothetical protein